VASTELQSIQLLWIACRKVGEARLCATPTRTLPKDRHRIIGKVTP